MKKYKITPFQYLIFTFFLLNSFISLIGYHSITKISLTSSIISIIIGYLLITIFTYFLRKIYHYKDNLNIIDKIKELFPKLNIILLLILLLITVTSILYSLNNTVTFINYYVLKDVDLIIITFTLLITIFYILTKDMDTIFKLAEICFYIYIFIFIIVLIGINKYINLYNIKPILVSDIKSIVTSSIIYLLSSIIPLVTLGIIPINKISKEKKFDSSINNAIKLSSVFIFFNLFLIITSLGIELTNIYQNPDMILFKKISFLNILERVESTIAFNNILNSLFFIIISIYFLKEIIMEIFKIKKQKEILFLSLIILTLIIIGTIVTIPQYLYIISNLLCLFVVIIIYIRLFIDKYIHQ